MADDTTPEAVQQASPASPSLRQALTDALGLPPETFMLEILLGEATRPVVRCHYYPTPEAMQQAVVVLAEYQLQPKPQTAPETIPEALPPPAEEPVAPVSRKDEG